MQGTPGGTAPTVTTFTPAPARFRLMVFANAQNLLNHPNYGGYSGTLTSPFFGQPTMVTNPRKVDIGIGFSSKFGRDAPTVGYAAWDGVVIHQAYSEGVHGGKLWQCKGCSTALLFGLPLRKFGICF